MRFSTIVTLVTIFTTICIAIIVRTVRDDIYQRNLVVVASTSFDPKTVEYKPSSLLSSSSSSSAAAAASTECSCQYNPNTINNAKCCRRRYIKIMKQGANALKEVCDMYFPNVQSQLLKNPIYYPKDTLASCRESVYNDCREVIITRHFYDSLVSGYLYHKKFAECYDSSIPLNKRPIYVAGIHQHTKSNYPWQFEDLNSKLHVPDDIEPINQRNLCEYIAEETEYDGMRLYIEFVFWLYLQALIDYRAIQEEVIRLQEGQTTTLFRCYDELTDPSKYENLVRTIRNWMYPGIDEYDGDKGQTRNKFIVKPLKTKYKGLHSSGGSTEKRMRLYNLVQKIDMNHYNGMILQESLHFGCQSELTLN